MPNRDVPQEPTVSTAKASDEASNIEKTALAIPEATPIFETHSVTRAIASSILTMAMPNQDTEQSTAAKAIIAARPVSTDKTKPLAQEATPKPTFTTTRTVAAALRLLANKTENFPAVLNVEKTNATATMVQTNSEGAVSSAAENNTDPITTIFNHWRKVMEHPRSHLDPKRKALIRQGLQLGYSSQQLCEAITGCSYTPHNVGSNEQGQRYDGLHVILRNADQIDRFIYNCHHPPKLRNPAEQRLQANLDVANQWVRDKIKTARNYV